MSGTRPGTDRRRPRRGRRPPVERLADAGREALHAGDPATARSLLEEGLGLWRGPALLEFSHLDFAWGFAARLEERRLVATEDRIEADLRLGRHDEVIGELGELVAAHPLREQLRHHLALALYRAGRQAEALRVLDDAARTLRDQLGIDPGQPLRLLEVAILNHDPPSTWSRRTRCGPPHRRRARRRRRVRRQRRPARRSSAARPSCARRSPRSTRPATAGASGRVEEPGISKTRLVEELAAAAAGEARPCTGGGPSRAGPPRRSGPGSRRSGLSSPRPRGRPCRPSWRRWSRASGDGPAAADALGARFPPVRRRRRAAPAAAERRWSSCSTTCSGRTFRRWSCSGSWPTDALAGAPVLWPARCAAGGRRNDTVVETLATLSRAPATRRLTLRGLPPVAVAELVAVAAGGSCPPR